MKQVRQQKIMDLLKSKKDLSTEDLATRFNVTTQTIRRDLEELESQGLVVKMYGGAVLAEDEEASSTWMGNFRNVENNGEKEAIADAAAMQIEDGSTIAMDSGSTTRVFGMRLKEKNNLIIITRDVVLASYLVGHPTNKVYVIGGFIDEYAETSGAYVEEFLDGVSHIDYFVFSTGGVTPENGFTSERAGMEDYRTLFIPKAKNKIALVDNTKFGVVCFYRACDLKDADHIITDSGVDKNYISRFKDLGIDINVVEPYD